MGPGKDIESNHIGAQVKYSGAAKYAADQRNTDESAVGIDRIVSFDTVVFSVSFADQQYGDQDACNMGNRCRQEESSSPRTSSGSNAT